MQTHFLRVFVANLKNDAIYAFYPESFCDNNLAIRKVFAFSDSACTVHIHSMTFYGSKEILPDEGIEDAPEQHNPQVTLHCNFSVVCFSLFMQSSEIVDIQIQGLT